MYIENSIRTDNELIIRRKLNEIEKLQREVETLKIFMYAGIDIKKLNREVV